jgi:hypothetical protein
VVADARPDEDVSDRDAARTRFAVEAAVVVLATLFVVYRLRPSLLVTNTLPAGGDLAYHDWGPDFLRREVLPDISGWSWDWFDGFPAFVFYPAVPAVAVAGLSFVLPYGVAMKLVIVSGLVTLPALSWLFARWWRLPFPAAPLVAVATVGFVFDTSSIAGGTIDSTVYGEYSYTLGLALAVVTLGIFSFVVREGRLRTTAAIGFAGAALAHPLTGLFVLSIAVAVVLVHLDREWRVLLRRVGPVVAAGAAVAGVWWIPFAAWRGWMTSPDFPRSVGLHYLFPFGWPEPILAALTVAGVVLAWRSGRRIVGALAILAALYALLFLVLPVGQFENDRVLPFWSWCRLSLAAVGAAELVLLGIRHWKSARGLVWGARLVAATSAVALFAVVTGVSVAWRLPPFGHAGEFGADKNIQIAFAGYQRNPQYTQYKALMDTMTRLGSQRGCGRFAWSVDVNTSDFGTVANDLAPYWTHGCITSLRGIYFDSSATTPFIGLTESLTSINPLEFVPNLPYEAFNLSEGVRNLQYAGVRYYAARTPSVVSAANAQPLLVPVATSGPWHIYEVQGASVVSPLPDEPVVLAIPGVGWKEGSVGYTVTDRTWYDEVLARTGPTGWRRLTTTTVPASRPLPAVHVSEIAMTSNGLSFHVDRTGVPVLVKASYFPTWSVKGGRGPYQVAGNMMVVIPTASTVRLVQTKGAVDWIADVSGFAGVVGLATMYIIDRRRRREVAP